MPEIRILNGNKINWQNIQGKPWFEVGRREVYCGRRHYRKQLPMSPLHNPYKMKCNEEIGELPGERDRVNYCFKLKLRTDIRNWQNSQKTSGLLSAIILLSKQYKKGSSLDLVCHCAPKACHCEYIKLTIEWLVSKGKV